jgi:hypothetical protein
LPSRQLLKQSPQLAFFIMLVTGHHPALNADMIQQLPAASGILSRNQIDCPEHLYCPRGYIARIPDRSGYDVQHEQYLPTMILPTGCRHKPRRTLLAVRFAE